MWPAQHMQQFHQQEAGLVLVVPPLQQPEQQYVQPSLQQQQLYGAQMVQHPLDIQQAQTLAPQQMSRLQQPGLQQRQQQLFHQAQQFMQQPQHMDRYGQPAMQLQQQQLPGQQQAISHPQALATAAMPLLSADMAPSWQQRQIVQQEVVPAASASQLFSLQHQQQQQYVQQPETTPRVQAGQQIAGPAASQWRQQQIQSLPAVLPAAAPQWQDRLQPPQQYEPEPQHLYNQQQQQQYTVPPAVVMAPAAMSAAADGGMWQQQQQPVLEARSAGHQRQMQQQYQSARMLQTHPAAAAAAAGSVFIPSQPMQPPAQRNWQQKQQTQSQQGQQQHRRQQQQQQQQQQWIPASEFDFDQWQQQSSRWRTQGRQQREFEQQQQQQPRAHKQQQQPRVPKQQQQLQQGSKPHQQKQKQQPQKQGHMAKQQGQQHQVNGQAKQQQQQQPVQQQGVKLTKSQKKAHKKLQQQQESQQQGQQQQQVKEDTEQQPQFPLMKLPPRVIAAIAALLPEVQRLRLAELLPQGSAAAAAVWGSISSLILKQSKGARLPDVPQYVARMRGLQRLTARVWMDGTIQARTGLAALSNLTNLIQLELMVDVDNDMKLAAGNKPKQAAQQHNNNPKRRKFGAEAPPQPSLTQQLDEQLLNPAMKIQEDFWQITSAVGKLGNLQELSLICCNNSNDRSKQVFKQLGYQSLAPLSGLTRLVSLRLKYSVCQAGAGLASLSGLTGITSLSLEELGGVEITDGEPGVAALSGFWQNALQLQELRLKTPCLGPEIVRQLGLKAEGLRVLDVSGCKGLFPSFRTWGHLRRLQGLQELHASNCIGITAADLETVASALTSSLTVLDISLNTAQPDGGDLRGSIDALGRLTNLQHLNAFGSCIAPVGDGSEGGVCSILAQLTQLTFLSVGSVQRSVMVMPADDVAHLSALTGLKKLQIAGAQLGVGLDIDTDTSVVLSRLDFLRRLYRLNYVRLWACRFSKFGPGRVSGLLRTQLLGSRLQKRNCIVLDSQWYPDRTHAVHDEPAEYSGDGDDQPTAAAVNDSST